MGRLERIAWFICLISIILAPSIFAHRSDRSPQVATAVVQSAGDIIDPVGDVIVGDNETLINADATAGNMTVTLPDAATVPNVTYKVVKIDTTTNKVTVIVAGGDTIGNSTQYVLRKEQDALNTTSDGSNYVAVVPMDTRTDGRIFGLVGDNVTDDRAALALAITNAVAGELHLTEGVYRVATNLTIDRPIIMDPGAQLSPDAGVTITIDASVNFPLTTIFVGDGDVTFTQDSVDFVVPIWWGTNSAAFDEAIDAAVLVEQIEIPAGFYSLVTSVDFLDVLVNMPTGAVFDVSAGQTVTINETFTATPDNHFDGDGTIVFTQDAVDFVVPIWWGTNQAAFDDSIVAANLIEQINIPAGFYDLTQNTDFLDLVVNMEPGAILDIDPATTVTLGGTFTASADEHFQDTGTVTFTEGSVDYVIPQWWGVTADGVTDDGPAMNEAIAGMAGTVEQIQIPPGFYSIATNVDLLSKMMNMTPGAILDIDNGVTVTMGSGTFVGGLGKHFQGLGTVIFQEDAIEYIVPQWWGATGDGATDDTVAIQAAIDTASAGMTVVFPPGSYKVTTELLIDKSTVTIKTAGAVIPYYETKSNHSFTAADGVMLKAASLDDAWNVVVAANDVLVLTSDEGGPVSLDVPDGRYNRTGLGTALQAAMNADGTLTGGTITFVVTYSSATEKYTIDATAGHTIAYTDSGSDGGALFGFTSDAGAAQTITSDTALPIAVVRIKAGLVTWDGVGIDGEESTDVDYGIWLDGSEASIGSYNSVIYGNIIKNCAVVDLFKASATGILDQTWFTHIENCWIRNIRDGIGIDVRNLNSSESSTTHTIQKVLLIYCELAFRIGVNTQGVTIRDSVVIACRLGLAAYNTQLLCDNVQWEDIGFDNGGSHGFISDQIRGFYRSGDFLEGPIYLNGTTVKFHKNQFQYVQETATGTATAEWWRHGWFVGYATANAFTKGVTINLDHCEFARSYETTTEMGYKLFRFRANSNVRTSVYMCAGLDRLDYDQCSFGEGYTMRDNRLYWYESDPVKFVAGRFEATYAGVPDWGGWEIGDLVYDPSNSNIARACTVAGYNRAIAGNVSTTNGSDEITITTPPTGYEFPVGSYISIAGVTGTKKITELMTVTKRKIDVVADATVAAAATVNVAATFKIPNDWSSHDLAGEILENATTPPLILTWVSPATTELDLSGNGNDATYSNFLTTDQVYKGLVWGLSFGGGRYLTVSDDAAFSWDDTGSNPFSICAWVEVVAGVTFQTIIAKKDIQNTDREWIFAVGATEQGVVEFWDEADDKVCDNKTDAALSEGWHFLVHTYNSTGGAAAMSDVNSIWYVDGVAVAESQTNDADYTGMVAGATDVTIGSHNSGAGQGNFFQGDMGVIWIEDVELSAAQVWSIYENTRGFYNE